MWYKKKKKDYNKEIEKIRVIHTCQTKIMSSSLNFNLTAIESRDRNLSSVYKKYKFNPKYVNQINIFDKNLKKQKLYFISF